VSAEALAAHREEAATRRFVMTLVARSNPFTMIFIGANFAMFAIEWLSGGMGLMSANDEVLRALGMKDNYLILEQGEYWRLISCIFLHIGLIHLLLNNYALWIVGQEIERLYGSARFVLLYFGTGVVASVCSLYFSAAPSAGASGAIFGLFGVLGTFGFRYQKEVPKAIGKRIRARVLPLIAINLFIGYQSGIVDNYAHVGGLLAGVVLALVVPYKRPGEKSTPVIWRGLEIACLVIVAAALIFAFRNFSNVSASAGGFSQRVSEKPSTVDVYFASMNGAARQFEQSARLSQRALRDGDFEALSQASQANRSALEKVPTGHDSLGGDAEAHRQRLIDFLARQSAFVQVRIRSSMPYRGPNESFAGPEQRAALLREHSAFVAEFNSFFDEFKQWAVQYGSR
jgi:rhomboid protease GluP